MNTQLKVLAIHSFAIHGTASMKVMLSLLGSYLLPVPSLLLTGLTNMPGHVKSSIEFEKLLKGSFQLARDNYQRLIVYIGYLGNASQADIILSVINEYKDIIETIIVDPVSGDHGRIYVPKEVIAVWPRLLVEADWAFPNYTELQLLSGVEREELTAPRVYLDAFSERYPNLSFLATSLPDQAEIGVYIYHEGVGTVYRHERLPRFFGGTGDVFGALFIKHYWLQQVSLEFSVKYAAEETYKYIERSTDAQSNELWVVPGG